MTHSNDPTTSIYCPLCQKRPPNTKVEYDELVASETTVSDGSMFADPNIIVQRTYNINNIASRYTNNSQSTYGELMVCAECAARYERSVTLRALSRPLMLWGVAALVVGIVVFVVTLAPHGSPWELLAFIPLVVAVGLFASGLGASMIGRSLAQPVRRYLARQRASVPA